MNFTRFLSGVYYGRYDKTVHFLVSVMMTTVFLALMPPAAAIVLAVLAGVTKEIYDYYHSKPFDLGDLAIDGAGIAVAWFVWVQVIARYVPT